MSVESVRSRRRRRSLVASSIALLLLLSMESVSPRAASAGEAWLSLGEVSSRVERPGVDIEGLVRSASEEELRALLRDTGAPARGGRVVVSVSLVRLETLVSSDSNDATCRVSATLRHARSGALFAVLSGEARVEGGATRDAAERSAMRGALRSALGGLSQALR